MTKKKVVEKPLEAPLTVEEYNTLCELWAKIKHTLYVLAPACSYTTEMKYSYPDIDYERADGFSDIGVQGVMFTYQYTPDYEDSSYAGSKLIPVDAIFNPQVYIDAFEAAKASVFKAKDERIKENEVATYQRLKAKFEK